MSFKNKGDIINYGSRGSTKLGKISCVFSLIPPMKVVHKRMIPPHSAGLKIIDPPPSTVPQNMHYAVEVPLIKI